MFIFCHPGYNKAAKEVIRDGLAVVITES